MVSIQLEKAVLKEKIMTCDDLVSFLQERDVDNDVIVDAREHYVKIGEFVDIKIYDAGDYDLYGIPV